MKIFSELNENQNLSLALGYFDGVHKGHQAVIKSAVDFAAKSGCKSAVITFKDHPCCYFWDVKPKYILTREDRRNKIEKLGIDFLYELDFNALAKLDAQEYLEKIIIKNFSPSAISTGFNHHFGINRVGNTDFLKAMSDKYGYKTYISEPVRESGEVISSTVIRGFLSGGDLKMANSMLGYDFSIGGTVVEGQHLGRKLGYKTANIIYPAELIDLPFGVYHTRVTVDGKSYRSVTNIGTRPTVSSSKACIVENHLLNFSNDIYGKPLRVEFLEMIRKERKFAGIEELKIQIEKDVNLIQNK